jgi:hypothetical protein
MKRKPPQDHRASYVVVLDTPAASDDELRHLATHLSTIGLEDFDVVVIDRAARPELERHGRTLRWVARHVAARAEHLLPGGEVDVVRAAADAAACEKIIVATGDVRYTPQALDQLVQLLDGHEVVEPQDYFDPLPWWAGIDAGRVLVHRGIEPSPDHGATFGFRRSAVRGLRGVTLLDPAPHEDPVRRLASRGAEVFAACDVFVRRKPQPLASWLGTRPRIAGDDFVLPMKTAFFFALVPLLLLLGFLGDARLAAGYAGMIAFASIALALRGRTGAGAFFPLHACFYAPLWILERSISVYWALARKLREDTSAAPVPQQGEGNRAQRAG